MTSEPSSSPSEPAGAAPTPTPTPATPATPNSPAPKGWVARWQHTPLYLRILGGVVLGVVIGMILGELSRRFQPEIDNLAKTAPKSSRLILLEAPRKILSTFEHGSKLVLRLLSALAPPLIFLAIVQTLMHAEIPAEKSRRLIFLLAVNTIAAILIGLLVANVVQPGKTQGVAAPTKSAKELETSPLEQFLDNVPRSVLGPFTDQGKVLGVIVVALAFGIALRRMKGEAGLPVVADLIAVLFRALVVMLHWIIEIIPFAILCVVANIIGTKGFGEFLALGRFVIAVLIALSLQGAYYLVRIRFGSWVRPRDVIRGTRDALVMAFSTASSTATMPLTYSCLRTKVGLREQSASLGALVGANFNNDGTALYEAMAALFVAQLVGIHLSFEQQVLVVIMSVVASVGAAGIPEAGLVTMTLVFDAVGLHEHKAYIGVLLAVDWFLDRCRTALNVMGDVNVSCLLDGKERDPNALKAEPELATLAE